MVKASRALMIVFVVTGSVILAAPAAAGGGCIPAESATTSYLRSEGPTATIDIEGCVFEPTVLYVEPGTKITWKQKDSAPHSVTGSFLAWGSTDLLSLGDSATYRFDEEGVYPYLCVLHPSMSAAVIVGDPGPESATAAAPPDEIEPQAATRDAQPVPAADGGSSWLALVAASALLASGSLGALAYRRRQQRGAVAPL